MHTLHADAWHQKALRDYFVERKKGNSPQLPKVFRETASQGEPTAEGVKAPDKKDDEASKTTPPEDKKEEKKPADKKPDEKTPAEPKPAAVDAKPSDKKPEEAKPTSE